MALAHRRPYGIYRLLANAPRWYYRLGLGWLLGHRVVQSTHRGRKSGLLRRTILEVLSYDPQTREVLVVSSAPHKSLHVVGESELANLREPIGYNPLDGLLGPPTKFTTLSELSFTTRTSVRLM